MINLLCVSKTYRSCDDIESFIGAGIRQEYVNTYDFSVFPLSL